MSVQRVVSVVPILELLCSCVLLTLLWHEGFSCDSAALALFYTVRQQS